MEEPDALEIVKRVLEDNKYIVSRVADHPMLLNIREKPHHNYCIAYLTAIPGGPATDHHMQFANRKIALDELFVRIDEGSWIELGLHDPKGFDELLKQLAAFFGKDQL